MRPAGEHREVQQPPLRQEQERGLHARGQLPAERAGPARGAARGLPLQLRDVAGERGLLPAHPVGGAAAESVMEGEGESWGGRGGRGATYEPAGVVLGCVLSAKMESGERSREERGLYCASVMEGWGRVKKKKLEMVKQPPRIPSEGRRWKMKGKVEQI